MNNETISDDDSGTVDDSYLDDDSFDAQNAEQYGVRQQSPDRRLFGLVTRRKRRKRVHTYTYQQFGTDDYTEKYPQDPYSEEMGPNARVYRVFLDEAMKINPELVENWRENLDGILVFAGLFSAVVTTIVVEASQNLQPDYSEITALLLAQQLGIQNGEATRFDNFTPKISDQWINGLWYTSLTFSLITALFAVLIKQWLQHFMTFVSGSPRDRARIIQSRRDALHIWRVEEIISMLPVLLHFSLFVFFMGLVILLVDLCFPIGVVVGSIVGACFIFYLISTAAPLVYPRCPYITPLSSILYAIIHFHKPNRKSLANLERTHVSKESDVSDARVLVWLQSAANFNPTVQDVIQQAVAGLRPGFSCVSMLNSAGITGALNRSSKDPPIHPNFSLHDAFFTYAKETSAEELEIYIRRSVQLVDLQDNTFSGSALRLAPHTAVLVQAALLSFYPGLPHFQMIRSKTPVNSSCFHGWVVEVIQFLAAQAEATDPLKLHPIIWERLLVVSAQILLLFVKGADGFDVFTPFAQTIALSFLDRHTRENSAVVLGVADEHCSYADGVRPVDLLDIRLRDPILYFLAVCFKLCTDSKQSIASVLLADASVVHGVLLEILLAPNAVCMKDRSLGLVISALRESVNYACEFLANECSVVTREVALLQSMEEDKREIYRVERAAEHHRLLQETALILHDLISSDAFRDEWFDTGGKSLVSLYHLLDVEFARLKTPLPLETRVDRWLLYRLLSYPTTTEKLVSVSGLVSRWFSENREDILWDFVQIGGIYRITEMFPVASSEEDPDVFHWRPELLTENTTCAANMLIAFIGAASRSDDPSVIAHCTEAHNIIYSVRILFGISILNARYQEAPGVLSGLALKSHPSTRRAWCHALKLVIRDTPKHYTLPAFTKFYFTKVEELIYITRARDHDFPGERKDFDQFVYVRKGQLRALPYSEQQKLRLPLYSQYGLADHIPIDFREIGHLLSNDLRLSEFIHLLAVMDKPPEKDSDAESIMPWKVTGLGSPHHSRSSSPDIGPLRPLSLYASEPSPLSSRLFGVAPSYAWSGSGGEPSMGIGTMSSLNLTSSLGDRSSSFSLKSDQSSRPGSPTIGQKPEKLPPGPPDLHEEPKLLNTIYEGSSKSSRSSASWTLSKVLRLTGHESPCESHSSGGDEDIIYSPSFSPRNAFIV